MTMTIRAIEFDHAGEAIQHADAERHGQAILLGGKPMVADQQEIDRIAEAGVAFAYLIDHEMPDGTRRIMTVPVN